MIKKIIGVVIAVAVIVIILVVALRRNRYASMVFDKTESEAIYEAQIGESGPVIRADADSLAGVDTVLLQPPAAEISAPAGVPVQ